MIKRILCLFTILFAIACSRTLNASDDLFRAALRGSTVATDFRVTTPGIYSVSIVNLVKDGPSSNRDAAWTYLSNKDPEEPATYEVEIRRGDGSIFYEKTVRDPELSSWSNERLNQELVRAKFQKGDYRLMVTIDKKTLSQAHFTSELLISRTYLGK